MDNLAQVPPEKQEKLAAVIKRLYAQIGTIREGTSRPQVTSHVFLKHVEQYATVVF